MGCTLFLHDIIIVTVILCSKVTSTAFSSCGYAEEGKPYLILLKNISYNINDYYTVTVNNTTIATCTEAQGCTILPFLDVTSIEISIGAYNSKDYMNITISLTNVTRMYSNSVWAVKVKLNGSKPGKEQMKEIGKCTLQVYDNRMNLVCREELHQSRIYFKCVSSRVYPRAQCIVNINMSLPTTVVQLETSVTHTSNPDNPNYFNSECVASIPTTNVSTATTLDFQVFMYPNITGNDSDIRFGVNTTFTIGHPSVQLVNCPHFIELEWSEINCTCQNRDNKDNTTQVNWYKNDKVIASNIQISRLSLNISTDITVQEIYCEAINSLGWKSEKLFYNPKFKCATKLFYVTLESTSQNNLKNSSFEISIQSLVASLTTVTIALVITAVVAIVLGVKYKYLLHSKHNMNTRMEADYINRGVIEMYERQLSEEIKGTLPSALNVEESPYIEVIESPYIEVIESPHEGQYDIITSETTEAEVYSGTFYLR